MPRMKEHIFLEIVAEMATMATEEVCGAREIKVWDVTETEESFTPEAQEIFNELHDKAEGILREILGDDAPRR